MARGRGGKAKRGGGHSFSRDLTLDENGIAVSQEDRSRRRRLPQTDEDGEKSSSDSEKSESTEEEESEDEDASGVPASSTEDPTLSRAEKKALKQAAKERAVAKAKATSLTLDDDEKKEGEEDPDLVNPNRSTGVMKRFVKDEPRELSRREREAKDKKEAKAKYQKLHAEGKTSQAKTDLARLAEIKKQREAAAAARKADADAKAADLEGKMAASKQR